MAHNLVSNTLEFQDASGVIRSVDKVVPNQWHGEADCVIGPFSCREVADYFASAVVDFGDYGMFARQVFVRGDSWYVQIGSRMSRMKVIKS